MEEERVSPEYIWGKRILSQGTISADTLMLGQPAWLWQKEGVGRLGDEVR